MAGDEDLRQRWNRRHAAATGRPEPMWGLRRFAHLLPPGGRALDLACGLGANALFLARRGFQVTAWDWSDTAIGRLRQAARDAGLDLRAEVRDVVASPPPPAAFDLVLVAHFLDRGLCPALAAALRPGGLLWYQTFVREAVNGERGPSDPRWRLGTNELLHLFPGLIRRVYLEEGRLGDPAQGLRDEALLIGQRPRAEGT